MEDWFLNKSTPDNEPLKNETILPTVVHALSPAHVADLTRQSEGSPPGGVCWGTEAGPVAGT